MYNNNEYMNEPFEQKRSISDSFLTKVYLYFALALGVAGVVAIGLSYVFEALWNTNVIATVSTVYILQIVTGFALVIMTFVMNFKAIKNRNSLFLLMVYALFWGLFLSTLVFYIDDPLILGGAFLISAFIFLGASLIGYKMKEKAYKVLSMVLIGIMIGVFLCCLLNFVFIPFIVFGGYSAAFWGYIWTYFLIEVIMILYVVIIVAIDTYKIKRVSDANMPIEVQQSMAVTCATNLFSDFIVVFIRILYILLIFFGGSRRR